MRQLTKVGVPSAVVLLSLGLPSPAFAGTSTSVYSETGNTLSIFGDVDELLTTRDLASDDHSSVTLLRLDSLSSSTTQYWNYHGAGTNTQADLNLAEGRVVYIRSCEGEWKGSVGASVLLTGTCGVWKKGVA